MKRLLGLLAAAPVLISGGTTSYQIEEKGAPVVYMTVGERAPGSAGIGIFQRDTGQPYATFLDKDGDGVFDLMTYEVLNAAGEVLISVEDYGMDGQADFKLHFAAQRAEVFYEGHWREAVGPRQKQVIVVEGQRIPLKEALANIGRDDF